MKKNWKETLKLWLGALLLLAESAAIGCKKLPKKVMALCVAAALLVAMVPSYVFAAETTYDLWVGGVQVTDANKGDITTAINNAGGNATGTATYDPATNTLTLNNFSYTGEGKDTGYCKAAISTQSINLKVKLIGTNTITCQSNDENVKCRAISVMYDTGEDCLTISGTNKETDKLICTANDGILSKKSLTVENATVQTNGAEISSWQGDITITGSIVSANVEACSNLTVKNSKLESFKTLGAGDSFTITNSTVTGGGLDASDDGSKITVTGSQVNVTAIDAYDIVIEGNSNVTAQAICVYKGLNVKDSSVHVTGGKIPGLQMDGNFGILSYITKAQVRIDNSTVEVYGGSGAYLYVNYSQTISESIVPLFVDGEEFVSADNYAVYAGDDAASATKADAPTDDTYASKYVKIEPAKYDLWVGGVQVTSTNLAIDSEDDPAIRGSATLTNIGVDENDEPIYTLTLKDFEYEGAGYEDWLTDYYRAAAAIYCGSSLIILLDGDSVITHRDINPVDRSCGIASKNGLIVSDAPTNGTGTLTVAGGAGYTSAGLYVYEGVLAINDGIITATAYEADVSSCPIISNFGDIIISGGEVNAHGGDTNSDSFGLIACYGISISDATVNATTNVSKAISYNTAISGFFANVEISNSTVTANAIGEDSAGIAAAYDLSISGSTVTANAIGEDSAGIAAAEDISISASTVTATGDTGIYAEYGHLTMNGGVLKATAPISENGDMGIVASSVAISDGTVEVMGDYSITTKYGVTIPEDFIVFAGNDAASASIVTTLESGVYLNKYVKIAPACTVTVKYGIDGVDNKEITVTKGDTISLENPVIDGCIFFGWYTDANFDTAFDFDTPITAATTIYAKFADYEGDKTELNNKIDAAKAELQGKMDAVNSALAGKADAATVNAAIAELQTAITALEAVKDNYIGADDALRTELEGKIATAKREAISAAETLVNNAKAELTAAINNKADTATLNAKINELNTAIATAEATAKAYTDDAAAALTTAIAMAKSEAISAAETLVNNAKSELQSAIDTKADATTVNAAIANLQNAIAVLENAKDNYVSADAALKAELEAAIAKAKQEAIDAAKGYIPYIGTNGNWWIGDTDTGVDANGIKGDTGADGVGIDKIEKTATNGNVDTYTVTLTNGKTYTFTVTNGKDGADGKDGANGKDGADGKDGTDGKDGVDGKDGLTPFIGENGNWWMGDTDTGVKAVVEQTAQKGTDTITVVSIVVASVALLSNLALVVWIVTKKKKSLV